MTGNEGGLDETGRKFWSHLVLLLPQEPHRGANSADKRAGFPEISVQHLFRLTIRGELGREPAFPIATDFDCCHTTPMLTLAQGVRVRLDTQGAAVRITVLEPAVVS